ncbi:pyruvate kinase [Saccharibacillus deserti]|uniref:pyruvate kinase n=1 Tax=Saccharibacillus deserti TaxID=1634444 RepID=UPI001554DE90|nr:pyruvate kinase [Saccharibacillus deserti]
MYIDIRRIYGKYLTLNIPNTFSDEQIHKRLTEVYYAEKVDLERFADLRKDAHANFEHAAGAYVFEDPRGTAKLARLNAEEEPEDSSYAWVMNSTQIGMSDMLTLEITIFHGIAEEEIRLGNLRFEEYLVMLYLTGHIELENDEQVEQARDLYKNGHYLRYFGAQNGSGVYLYRPEL